MLAYGGSTAAEQDIGQRELAELEAGIDDQGRAFLCQYLEANGTKLIATPEAN